MNKEIKITTWHSSDGTQCLISEMPLSHLMASINYFKNNPGAREADWGKKGKYPRGTTGQMLLDLLEREKYNRKLRRNVNLFE